VLSDWSPFSNCTQPCGGGTQTRTRTVITPAANGGAVCGTLSETVPCNQQPCPVNCEVGEFSNWSACSQPCGGGTQTRSRTVTTLPANGGTACPTLSESQPCNQQGCPVNCVMNQWSDWGVCSATCGGGSQTRTRTVATPAANGGTACGPTSETQPCNTNPCPVDCVTGTWSDWGTCSAPCGGGTQTRNLSIITPAANGGTPCPSVTTETQPCNTTPCLPAFLQGNFIFNWDSDTRYYLGPDGSVSSGTDFELDTDCETEVRCQWKFIPSKWAPNAYFVESIHRPGIYWKIFSTSSDTRLNHSTNCNPDINDTMCQWQVADLGSGRVRFSSLARPSLRITPDGTGRTDVVRVQSNCSDTSRSCIWRLRSK